MMLSSRLNQSESSHISSDCRLYNSLQWQPNLRPSQPTGAMSSPVGLRLTKCINSNDEIWRPVFGFLYVWPKTVLRLLKSSPVANLGCLKFQKWRDVDVRNVVLLACIADRLPFQWLTSDCHETYNQQHLNTTFMLSNILLLTGSTFSIAFYHILEYAK